MAAPDREPITVTADGITVQKMLNLEDFDTMAIVYEVTSNRDDDTRFHIEDKVPEGITTGDIDFRPRHEAAECSLSAESVTVEDKLAPGEDSRIILGIKKDPETDLERLTAEPTVELLETEVAASGSASNGEDTDLERAGGQVSSRGVGRVLANELRRDELDEQARRQLRDEFGDTESAFENQLSDLEERIDDLEEYQPPMEEFLSEYGPVERIISAIGDELSELEEAITTMQDRTGEVVGSTNDIHDRIEGSEDDLERVDARLETLEESFQTLQGEIGTIDDRIEDNEDQADQVEAGVRGLEQGTDDLEGNLADFQGDLESIRESIRGDVQRIEADLESFESFRDRLSAAFGGEGGSFDIESDDG